MQNFLQPLYGGSILSDDVKSRLGGFLAATTSMCMLHAKILSDFNSVEHPIEVLTASVGFLKCYFPYVQAYPVLSLELTDANNKPLMNFLSEACLTAKIGSIMQLLILPIQRPPRYVLLIEALEKFTPIGHSLEAQLFALLDKMRGMTHQINDCQKESEKSMAMFRIFSQLSGCPNNFSIVNPTRALLREGVLSQIPPDKSEKDVQDKQHPHKFSVRVLLFNDVLLFASHNWQYISRVEVDESHLFIKSKGERSWCLSDISGDEGKNIVCATTEVRNEWVSQMTHASFEGSRLKRKLLKRKGAKKESGQRTQGMKEETESDISKINLILRVRPQSQTEKDDDSKVCMSLSDCKAILNQKNSYRGERICEYDQVIAPGENQNQVFEKVGQEVLGAMLAGFNTAVLAYGSTGAGKTYTMFGDEIPESERKTLHDLSAQGPTALAPCLPMSEPKVPPCLPSSVPPEETPEATAPDLSAMSAPRSGRLTTIDAPNKLDTNIFLAAAAAAAAAARSLKREGKSITPPPWASPPPIPHSLPDGEDEIVEEEKFVEPEQVLQELYSGLEMEEKDPRGLVPRILEGLFAHFECLDYQHEVAISYIQVYNNQINDLQSPGGELVDLPFKRSLTGSYSIKNLISTNITSGEQAIEIINKGNEKRSTRAMTMNEMSSRSHAIVILSISFTPTGEKKRNVSSYLVDLAGSETAEMQAGKDEKDTDLVKEESKFISTSLISLSRVVAALSENSRRGKNHQKPVPFRESKLTHILSPVLAGNFCCSLILNASPSDSMGQDILTAKTMAFGEGVKNLDGKINRNEAKLGHWLKGFWGASKSFAR